MVNGFIFEKELRGRRGVKILGLIEAGNSVVWVAILIGFEKYSYVFLVPQTYSFYIEINSIFFTFPQVERK